MTAIRNKRNFNDTAQGWEEKVSLQLEVDPIARLFSVVEHLDREAGVGDYSFLFQKTFKSWRAFL